MAETNEKLIFQKIPAIMADVGAIGKNRENDSQHYSFRGIDDVYNELHELLAKHKVFTVPEILTERHEERKSRSGSLLIYRIFSIRYTFYAEDGSSVAAVVVGEGMDSGDKAGNKAMSVAHKYALLQVFCIPTDDPKDPENDSPQVNGEPKAPKTYSKKKPAEPIPDDGGIADLAYDSIQGRDQGMTEWPKDITMKTTQGVTVKVDKFGALRMFQKMKGALGQEIYYSVLGDHGYEKSNQIKKADLPKVYASMIKAHKEMTDEDREGVAEAQEDADVL